MSIILSFLVFTSALGMPLTTHYCKGEVKHVTLFHKKSCHEAKKHVFACCLKDKDTCSQEGENSCCSDDVKLLQNDDPALVSALVKNIPAYDFVTLDNPISQINIHEITEDFQLFDRGSPPDIPLFILYSSLTFYG